MEKMKTYEFNEKSSSKRASTTHLTALSLEIKSETYNSDHKVIQNHLSLTMGVRLPEKK